MATIADSIAVRPATATSTGRIIRQFAAACGALYVVLTVIGNEILGNAGAAPALDAPASDYARFFAANTTTTTLIGVYVEIIALGLFLVFAGVLWSVLKRAEGESYWLSTIGFGAVLVMLAIKFASGGPVVAAMFRADEGVNPEILRALSDINSAMFVLTWVPLALFLATAAGVIIQTRVLPRWLGWTGAFLAAGLVIGTAAIWSVEFAFVPAGLSLLWIVAASIALVRHVRSQDQNAEAGSY